MSNIGYQPFQALTPLPRAAGVSRSHGREEAFLPQGSCSGLHLLKDDWIAEFAASQLSTPTAARASTTAEVSKVAPADNFTSGVLLAALAITGLLCNARWRLLWECMMTSADKVQPSKR